MQRVAIVGAGAVGGYVAAFLARDGVDVVAIDAWPAHVEAIRAGGLRIDMMEPGTSFSQKLRAHRLGDRAGAALPGAAGLRRLVAE